MEQNTARHTSGLYRAHYSEDIKHGIFYKPENTEINFPGTPSKKNQQVRHIIEECGIEAFNFIKNNIHLSNNNCLFISTASPINIKLLDQGHYDTLVNLKRINDIRYLNKFFETANEHIPYGGTFIGCAETKNLRKKRILKKYPPVLNYLYYTLDFILKRIFPKHPLTKKFYFWLTAGRNRVISRPEILGRLYSCGFEIKKEQTIGNLYYFFAKKNNEPVYDTHPSYGMFIKMPRIGKNGKYIHVYKLRTMHPYSEYIQEYIYTNNNIEATGKFNNDFRITTIGRFLRKFWIDEIPMLYNLLNGDIKLVGVRPLSRQYFSLYPDESQQLRSKYKPGLLPPFYKDLPKSFAQIIDSEKKYLESYEKHPLLTDIKYFFAILNNILIKRVRSK
jgi:lipopolysaccharide/colanic/teichoic acid biosynthesis glycosyltransferase